jgi:hypothetical protein
MSQEKEKSKILLIFRPEDSGDEWPRLNKALSSFNQVETKESNSTVSAQEVIELSQQGYEHIFLDLSIADFQNLKTEKLVNLTLVKKETFAWNNPEARKLTSGVLLEYPCLILEKFSLADLIRVLHLYLNPKRLSGTTPLMEKGALVIAEKIQSMESLGTTTDKLCSYLQKIESFALVDRIPDLRQVLQAIIQKAYTEAKTINPEFPTVDFQVGVNKSKLAINLRFPKGGLDPKTLPQLILDGKDLFWSILWNCADVTLITHHVQYEEIETMLFFHLEKRVNYSTYKTFLIKESKRSMKSDSLLVAPQNFDFKILSEIEVNTEKVDLNEYETSDTNIDFGSLPEEVVKKMAKLTEESIFLKDQAVKKDEALREIQTKCVELTKELNQKRGESMKLIKSNQMIQEATSRKLADYEKKIEFLNSEGKEKAQANEAAPAQFLQEAIGKLESSLKVSELEKNQLTEKALNEQKKLTLLEQKYSTLFKEVAAKDKEISELKAAMVKIRKENATGAASAASSGGIQTPESVIQKLKETEARENALKQELKKIAFKLEHSEKNVKAIQNEASEKSKLLEQKLQGAKTKEVELLKKIEELSAALKKAAKAA